MFMRGRSKSVHSRTIIRPSHDRAGAKVERVIINDLKTRPTMRG